MEELGHLEMVGTLVYQLSDGASGKDWLEGHTPEYYADNGNAVFPQNAQGSPFNAAAIASTGDPITNLFEDLAAEQKARATYEYLLDMASDPDVIEPLRFLRQREVVHFQRFGEPIHTNLRRFSPYEKLLGHCKSKQLFLFLLHDCYLSLYSAGAISTG